MALPRPHGRSQWIALAQGRLVNILSVRIAANIRQLEVKVCEAGPEDKRPQPHILSLAVTRLIDAGRVRIYTPEGLSGHDETRFYTLREFYPDRARARVADLMLHYRMHRWLANTDEYCSSVLEGLVRSSFDAAGGYQFLGKLPKPASLDAVYTRGGLQLGVEVKNTRPWVYPMTAAVWVMIRKCLQLDAVPLLIARKIGYLTRTAFAAIGALSYEVHRQFFAPAVAHLLGPIQHKDALGYKDVIAVAPDQPLPFLARFLQTLVPHELPAYRRRWEGRHDLLQEFAVRRGLGDPNLSDEQRRVHEVDFYEAVFGTREYEV
jgi:hypothetical protein